MKTRFLPFLAAISVLAANKPTYGEYIGAANIAEMTDRVYYITVKGKNPELAANKGGILTWTDVAFATGLAAVSSKCAAKNLPADTYFYVLYIIGNRDGWWQVNCGYTYKITSEFKKDYDAVLMLLNQEGRKELLHPLLITTKQQSQKFKQLRKIYK